MDSTDKKWLRSGMRQKLRNMPMEIQESKSKQIRSLVEQSGRLAANKPILIFASLPGEPILLPLLERHEPGPLFCFPRVVGTQLEIRQVSSLAGLLPGYAGILEPQPETCPLFPIHELKAILLPGLLFDPSTGGRLGKGKGYYDRLLEKISGGPNSSPTILGVCFSEQLGPVPLQSHDQNVDAIVTEKKIIQIPGSPFLTSA